MKLTRPMFNFQSPDRKPMTRHQVLDCTSPVALSIADRPLESPTATAHSKTLLPSRILSIFPGYAQKRTLVKDCCKSPKRAEIRRPKPERTPNSEARIRCALAFFFGFRTSTFLRPSDFGSHSLLQQAATFRSWSQRLTSCVLLLSACTCLTGCFGFLKPATSSAQKFVLTPLPHSEPVAATSAALAVGVGPVKLPAYLFDSSLAIRKGTNEINYLAMALWAERQM